VKEMNKGASTLSFLAHEKEFGWLFIYSNALEVQHIERTVHFPLSYSFFPSYLFFFLFFLIVQREESQVQGLFKYDLHI